jgi:hypothetical protein
MLEFQKEFTLRFFYFILLNKIIVQRESTSAEIFFSNSYSKDKDFNTFWTGFLEIGKCSKK